ncbi:transcriptional repressor AgaR [Rheinheimera texasensis]|uniref:transcriptional repressor AgaR n=1 Tax=Rheinheimera texasensis TaxID=306205 RepID=UPI0032B2BC9D
MEALNTIERQQEIVRLTNAQGKVSVAELSQRFGVSEVTIRSDLAVLDSKRLLVRSRGGAMVNDDLSRELSLKEKRQKHSELKQRLGRAVAELIKDDERIILDSGTTTEEVAANLREHKNLIVMTNGLNIALELSQVDKVEVMMTGGTLRKKSMSFYGAQAEQALKNYQFDKVVLGVDGFDLKTGLSTHFEAEATLNRLMCEVAREVIVVTDSSKFDRRGFHLICSVMQVHTLVTDSGIPPLYVEELTRMGVQVHVISP